MTEYESLHAEHQSLKDTNLEEQKASMKESEQPVLEVWEDIKKTMLEKNMFFLKKIL